MLHLTSSRNGKPISANAWLLPVNPRSWNPSSNHLSFDSSFSHPDAPILWAKSSIGVKISHLATDFDASINDRDIYSGMDCCGAIKKIIQSASWHWIDHIHSGAIPIFLRMVDVSQGTKA